MPAPYLIARELFYTLTAAVVLFFTMELLFPNIVQTYIPLNAVLLFWLALGMVTVYLHTISPMIEGVIVKKIGKYSDERGWLAEIWRNDELDFTPAMAYASMTKPGVVRGPHEHVKQSDCFIFTGPGTFDLYLWDHRDGQQRADLPVSATAGTHVKLTLGENEPTLVIVPPGVVHGYKNVSDVDALSINLPNALYRGKGKREEVDEIRWEENTNSPYVIT